MLPKFSKSTNIAKALFPIYLVENPRTLPCFATFSLQKVINIFQPFLNFETIISPVNRDFLFDLVNLHEMHAESTWRYKIAL